MNEGALPMLRGPVVIACAAPYGVGGMGRHLRELVEFSRARGLDTRWFASDARIGPAGGEAVKPRWTELLKRLPPMRFSAAWQGFIEAIAFDRAVAAQMPKANTFIGFNGQALRSMSAARRRQCENVLLAAATPYVNLTVRQAKAAWNYAPIEPLGYIGAQHRMFLHEYAAADRIVYATEYVRKSFVDEGTAAEKLTRFDLSADARYTPAPNRPADEKFRIVSVGSLNLVKGVAVLLDAFAKFTESNAELTLVGGSGTRQMRRYLDERMSRDKRIRIAPGDPLPYLQKADVCAHAAFQDGFAYAPVEALACGVPVIVTEDTGMKEYVREGINGFVVRTGDANSIVTALHKIRSTTK